MEVCQLIKSAAAYREKKVGGLFSPISLSSPGILWRGSADLADFR